MAGQLVYHPGVLIPDAVVVRRLEVVHTRVATTRALASSQMYL